ncbi:glucosaminidase domain-containing protein, partial [bacterium]|nr:glucosaminidase domain-containing protein [bacterium]
EKYNTARDAITTVKTEELEKAKATAATKQSELDEINAKIDTKKAEETKSEYSTSVNQEFLNDFNAQENFNRGVLAGKGELIASIAAKNNIDPYLLASIMAFETGWGTSNAIKNYNNPGGIMKSKGGLNSYGSLEEGINAMAKLLRTKYLDDGLHTIGQIQKRYCPVGASNDPNGVNKNWLNGVVSVFNMIKKGSKVTADTYFE